MPFTVTSTGAPGRAASTNLRPAARVARKVPVRVMSMTRLHSSSLISRRSAVPPRPAVSPIAYVAVGPKISVIGANGILMPNIAVLAIRFTPSG